MKKYIKPDISLLYFEAEHITVGQGDITGAEGLASQQLILPDENVTVTGSVKFADIQKLN